MTPEFKKFPKISRFDDLQVTITQKINGTNAQIYIYEAEMGTHIAAGSRNRWLDPHADNFGFCSFVTAHELEIVRLLGPGRHYGEWAGPGINSGEGLSEKGFYLFNYERWAGKEQDHHFYEI